MAARRESRWDAVLPGAPRGPADADVSLQVLRTQGALPPQNGRLWEGHVEGRMGARGGLERSASSWGPARAGTDWVRGSGMIFSDPVPNSIPSGHSDGKVSAVSAPQAHVAGQLPQTPG